MPIPPDAISVVVQGPVVPGRTEETLSSIRQFLPGAELILSTWKGSDVSGLSPDVLVLSDDPGAVPAMVSSQNINRQIRSTANGLAHAVRPYAIKLRSDCFLRNAECLTWFDRARSCPRPISPCVFNERVIICRHFTRNPARSGILAHPSDIFSLGKVEDLRRLWSVPFATELGACTEQYVWLTCLKSDEQHLRLTDQLRFTLANIWMSERALLANFYVVEASEVGLEIPVRTANNPLPLFRVDTCYTRAEWENLSGLYCRSSSPLGRGIGVLVQAAWECFDRPIFSFAYLRRRLRPVKRAVRQLVGKVEGKG